MERITRPSMTARPGGRLAVAAGGGIYCVQCGCLEGVGGNSPSGQKAQGVAALVFGLALLFVSIYMLVVGFIDVGPFRSQISLLFNTGLRHHRLGPWIAFGLLGLGWALLGFAYSVLFPRAARAGRGRRVT